MNLALEHLRRMGVPLELKGSYSQDEAVQLLQGRPVEPAVADRVHSKLAWIAGQQLVELLIRDAPELGWIRERIVVRTLPSGESSASFQSFPDDSHAVLVSRALQESLIAMANILVFMDVTTSPTGWSLRRRRQRKENKESVGRVTSALRYMMLGHRMTGRAPRTPAILDEQSFDFAGQIAIGAVMFVIAHEIAHLVHGDSESSIRPYADDSEVSIGEVQELQADSWAFNLLAHLLALDPADPGMPPEEIALWSAFTAIFATQITEKAIYVRRNRTHPEAWARWAVLEKHAPKSDGRTDSLRLAFQGGAIGAMKLDEGFPDKLWPLLWKDEMLSVEERFDLETLRRWDLLNTRPVLEMARDTERAVTPAGRELIADLRQGDLAGALGALSIPDRRLSRILDPSLALEFSTLRSVLDDSPVELTTGDRDAFSVTAVRLAAEHLEGGFNP